MTQTWYEDTYRANHVAATDVERITSNFNTLRTMFSGTSSPSSPIAGMPWFDTTKKLLKIRNQANNEWLGVLMGLTTSKVAVYRNSAGDGWVDSGLTGDKILGIKGGSVYTAGAAAAGTWTISGLAGDAETTDGYTGHNHMWHDWKDGTGAGLQSWFFTSAGVAQYCWSFSYAKGGGWNIGESSTDAYAWTLDAWTARESHTHTVSHNGAWRPAASVVTIQYPNV